MTKDDVLRKLPCAEVLDKQAPTKRDLVILEEEALEYESMFPRDLEDIRIKVWRNKMKAALTVEARRKDWQTIRNFHEDREDETDRGHRDQGGR